MGNLQLLIAAIAILMATVVDAQVANIVTPAFFNGIRNRAPNNCAGKSFYTREAFIQAARSYPSFGNRESKREVAAFFAHVTHETGHFVWCTEFCYVEEIERGTYCDSSSTKYPCVSGKQYYGRGPLQLSWNYNYGACGKANGFDGLRNPEAVANDRVLTWKTALWFWTTSVRPTERKGFGETIHRVNGMECNRGNTDEVEDRVRYYIEYCKQLDVTPGQHIRC
ncbi:Endochitinase At2g43590 [Linum perenne]